MKKNKKLRSIKTMLIIGTLSLVIAPTIFVSAIAIRVASVSFNKTSSTDSETLTNIGTNLINSEIKRYTDIMNSLSDSNLYEKVRNNTEKEVLYDRFNKTLQGNTSLVDVYYSDKEGNFIVGSGITLPSDYNVLEQSWFKDNIDSDKEFSITNSYKDTNTGEMVVSMYKAIMKDGNSLGVLGMDINLSKLSEALLYVKQGDNGDIAVVDNTDKIIISSNSNLVGSNEQLNYDKWEYISSNKNGLVNSKYNSNKYKISFNTEELTGWKVFVKVPLSEIYAARNKLILINAMSTVGSLLLSSIIVVIASLRVSKLICKVQEGLNRVADCEFNFRLNIGGASTEFKEVEESFNKMQSNIEHLVNEVSSSIDVVNKEAEDSVTISTNILTSMNDVSETINQIADGTMHSSSDLDDISSKLEELSNNMNNIKNIVEEVTNRAIEANELGKEGLSISNLVMDKSKSTKESTNSVTDAVNSVANNLTEIEKMNQAIRSITEQTNLLALNAAIEASRAGELGKGFAVVADEIRKLAEETSISAKQIDEVIKTIRNTTNIAVEKVKETSITVTDQGKAVIESQEIFNKIILAIEELSREVKDIFHNISDVNNMKDNLVGQVSNLSITLEETAAGAEEVAALSEEVTSASSNSKEKFYELRDVVKELEELIKVFKVE